MLNRQEELLFAIYGLLLVKVGHDAGLIDDKTLRDHLKDLKDIYNDHLDKLQKGERA